MQCMQLGERPAGGPPRGPGELFRCPQPAWGHASTGTISASPSYVEYCSCGRLQLVGGISGIMMLR